MNHYLTGKITIELGKNRYKHYYINSKNNHSKSDIIESAKKLLNELPTTYLKFCNITLKVKRLYQNLENYESEWIDISNELQQHQLIKEV
jgi:hypothetical protein